MSAGSDPHLNILGKDLGPSILPARPYRVQALQNLGLSLWCQRIVARHMLTPGPDVLRPAELTSTEIADLLAQMYLADHGQVDDARSTQQRTADYLGCHEEARASAWEAWASELNPADWDVAEDWLDVEFVEPYLERRAV